MNKQMFTISNKLPSLSSEKLQQMKSFPSDCTLICRNGKVSAHRLILSASSSFLKSCILQSSGGFVFLPQYDIQDIRMIVDFIYGFSVTVDYEKMARLVDIAQDLGVSVFDQAANS